MSVQEIFVPEFESKARDILKSIEDLSYRERVDEEAKRIAWDAGQRFVFEEDIKYAEKVIKAKDKINSIEDLQYKTLIEDKSFEISRQKLHRYVFIEDVLEAERYMACHN
ncbi:hypothetical protein HYW74_01035 [Candidatus Pacearchaeota archaeon]|nr:hypothetical protein [Candidatus Pacearchaeota archaeon]